jgi:hypothetical protein
MNKYYYNFIRRIKKYGERFPKKHGEWYRIKVLGRWITLDTWNGRIALHGEKCEPSGNDVYGNLVCFHVDESTTLGFNFGDYKEHPDMNYWSLQIPANMEIDLDEEE